jgi:hypothetical protein
MEKSWGVQKIGALNAAIRWKPLAKTSQVTQTMKMHHKYLQRKYRIEKLHDNIQYIRRSPRLQR